MKGFIRLSCKGGEAIILNLEHVVAFEEIPESDGGGTTVFQTDDREVDVDNWIDEIWAKITECQYA